MASAAGLAYDARVAMGRSRQRIGLWMIGACGGVGSTVALGLAALGKRLTGTTGLVSALPEFESLGLIDAGDIVVGGHEIRSQTLLSAVRATHAESGVFQPEMIRACAPVLRRFQRNIQPGIVYGSTRQIQQMAATGSVRRVATAAAAVAAVRRDLECFRRRCGVDHVVVVNVASSEPPRKREPAHASYAKLARAMRTKGAKVLPASALYALGAVSADCSYINFTPSVGMRVKAIEQFAQDRDVLFAGRDGKTGETLVKSVLAPMFAMRNLKLHSWMGCNVLGNRDGEVLDDPKVKVSKLASKDRLVSRIVGYGPEMRTSIEYLPSLHDWKVAWDFIHFGGFLDTKMSLQFTWTGCDSILAAPLVIDLVRLTAFEYAAGRRGRMDHLACFFKDPDGGKEHGFADQWRRLVGHVVGRRDGGTKGRRDGGRRCGGMKE
ncbi:MAG: inositol-3-phosphate synthase [Phycisphaerae bacterium]